MHGYLDNNNEKLNSLKTTWFYFAFFVFGIFNFCFAIISKLCLDPQSGRRVQFETAWVGGMEPSSVSGPGHHCENGNTHLCGSSFPSNSQLLQLSPFSQEERLQRQGNCNIWRPSGGHSELRAKRQSAKMYRGRWAQVPTVKKKVRGSEKALPHRSSYPRFQLLALSLVRRPGASNTWTRLREKRHWGSCCRLGERRQVKEVWKKPM